MVRTKMIVVGITGGIGSGKSTFANILREKGYIVLDADKIARELLEIDGHSYFDVIKNFGNQIVKDNGQIDRTRLGDIVFQDESKLKILNEITHKNIRRKFEEDIKYYRNLKKEVIFLDVPLLFEAKVDELCDKTVLIYADLDTRIFRVQKRDGITEKAVRDRIAMQMDEEEKKKRADYILLNNENEIKLEEEADKILSILL